MITTTCALFILTENHLEMDDVVKIIRIETGGSEQTVKGLKDEINSLRDALLNTEKGSKEYKDILEQLIADQQKLTEVMSAGKTQISAATGSYNALVNQMAALKKVWRETTDEATRKDLGKQIKSLNDQLKGFDESIGDFRRNVGNYTQSITAAFSSMGGAAKGMIGPINGVKTAFNALASHPLVAVLTALAALLINGLVKGFQSSEEATNKLKVAFSGFKAIGDVVLKIFQGLALGIANLGNAIVNLLDKWGLLPESFKERQKIAEDEIKLTKKQRDNITKNADLEKEIAKLRADSADKNKYTTQQRLDFLEQAMKKEEEIAKNEYEALEQEYNIIVAKNALAKSNAVDKDAEAKAYAAKIAAETKYLEKKRSNNKEISRINKEMVRDAQQAELSMLNLQKDLIQQEYNLAIDGSDKQLQLAKELRKKELDIQISGFKQKIKNRKDYNQAVKMAIAAYNNDIEKLESDFRSRQTETEYQDSRLNLYAFRKNSSRYWAEAKAIETEHLNNVIADILATSNEKDKKELEKKRLEIENTLKEISDSLTEAEDREMEIFNQTVLNGTRPLSKYYKTQTEQLKDVYNNMLQRFDESDEEFKARKQEVWNQILTSESNYWDAMLDETRTKTQAVYLEELGGMENERVMLLMQEKLLADEHQNLLDRSKQYIEENISTVAEQLGVGVEQIRQMLGEEDWFDNENGLFNKLFQRQVLPEDMLDGYITYLQDKAQQEKAILDYRLDNWNALADGIKQIMGNVADIYEEDLKAQVEHGEKSEEQAEREFENIKGLRIAVAVIDTIQGALAAFMGWQEKGQPWGAIIGAVQAAAVTTAGIAQIAKIANTKFGSSAASSMSGGAPMASVAPVMMDYQPQMTGTVTGESETEELVNAITKAPIWVSVKDIDDAQERGRTRIAEATF